MLPALVALAGCTTGQHERMNDVSTQSSTSHQLIIELLALDLNTCGRCTSTAANLDAAIETVADVLREADVEVVVRKVVITSASQAEKLRFQSSPTIRVNGRDIALELRESNCGDCGDICGCEGQVDCRVWVWRGKEYTEAPKALIIDAILRTYAQAWEPMPLPRKKFRLPENLRKYFLAIEQKNSQGSSACCDRTICCDESEEESCCGVNVNKEMCGCEA
jgi:hypothetical protein